MYLLFMSSIVCFILAVLAQSDLYLWLSIGFSFFGFLERTDRQREKMQDK